jgi:HAD superfamily hydrolase (TIGR01509 family)
VASIRAIIFDLDGTVYRNAPVVRRMALRLAAHVARHPGTGWRTVQLISAYRLAQERLREAGAPCSDGQQLAFACEQTGADAEWASRVVARWMETSPLDLVRKYMRPDIAEFLALARRNDLRLAVFSDYPADAKLTAMEIRQHFDVVRWAQQSDVSVFKPNPRGLQLTAKALGVEAADALHVGDRPAVDVAAAHAAGMKAAIIGRHTQASSSSCLHAKTFRELGRLLELK